MSGIERIFNIRCVYAKIVCVDAIGEGSVTGVHELQCGGIPWQRRHK